MMNCPICQIRKLRLLLEGFTQDHSAIELELRSSDSQDCSGLDLILGLWTPRPALFLQGCQLAIGGYNHYRTNLYRMSATGPSKMEEIILNRKVQCHWTGKIHWFGKMEGHSVLSLEKWNEQVEISLWGWRTKRVRGEPCAA